MKLNYKFLIIIAIILIIGIGYYYKKSQEHYADQVMHWYAGGIAGPVMTPESVYGMAGEKAIYMERESY